MAALDALVAIVERLRAPDGCPWDSAQTPDSLRPMLLEETYEVLEAIDRGDDPNLREELGDLLFCITLLAQMKSEAGIFDLADVATDIADKMVRRHPHVFGNAKHEGVAGWEAIKAAERAGRQVAPPSALDGVPVALPALLRAQRIGAKAAAVGFDWKTLDGPRAKLDEEILELDEAVERAHIDATMTAAVEEELGDVLFSTVNLARHLGLSAEDALRAATEKFERRFRGLETELRVEGADPREMDAASLEARWQDQKRNS